MMTARSISAPPKLAKPLTGSPRAEFSPSMLALFLEARIVSRMMWRGEDRKVADSGFRRELATVSRVPAGTLDLARKGRVNAAMTRVKIWGALGIIPADRGVMLTDDGGQEYASRAAGAPAWPRNGSDALAGYGRGAQ